MTNNISYASLQTFNNDIIKGLSSLREKNGVLKQDIAKGRKAQQDLLAQKQSLEKQLEKIEAELSTKIEKNRRT
ncbi:hypothetical protein HDV03_004184 [Kappamyces sp. JEL0829]|nr:hypothetical protein HDV03_004184 [Kappamyces sp. JEL0829]